MGTLPRNRKSQRPPKAEDLNKVVAKIAKVITRGYIEEGDLASLTDYFAVAKGLADIRIVYNGSSSGLNAALWAPNFWLPTPSTCLRQLFDNSKCLDKDLGNMFLNFPMDQSMKQFAGVDVTSIMPELQTLLGDKINLKTDQQGRCLMRWIRLFMGMTPSPYLAIAYYYIAEELARGSRLDPTNPCQFDKVRFNIPGLDDHDPTLPWSSSGILL